MSDNNFSKGYIDSSSSALNDKSSIIEAQTHLQSLGMDIGSFKPDGQWGTSSQAAAKQWQLTNGYEATGDITERQMSVLEHQANNPSIYNRMKLEPFYQNFDTGALSNLDPVRANIIKQQASHLGVKEHKEPGAEEGDNSGPAIDQYAKADSRFPGQGAWCNLSDGWHRDQVEIAGGVGKDDFHKGNMRVHETFDQIREETPEAIADLRDYEPQAADIMLITRGDGTGHTGSVVASFDHGEGYSTLITMDGNVSDGYNLVRRELYTDPETGKTYQTDNEGNIVGDSQINIVDISRLPNYNEMNRNFNSSAEFIPTPSADPNFEPDVEQLAALQEVLEEKVAMSTPQPLPKLTFIESSTNINNTGSNIDSLNADSNVIEGDFSGYDAAQAGDPALLRGAREYGVDNGVEVANATRAPTVADPAYMQPFAP